MCSCRSRALKARQRNAVDRRPLARPRRRQSTNQRHGPSAASRTHRKGSKIELALTVASMHAVKSLLSAGAARGIRTPDPIITNDVLYQLSYCGPVERRRGGATSNGAAVYASFPLVGNTHSDGSAGRLGTRRDLA